MGLICSFTDKNRQASLNDFPIHVIRKILARFHHQSMNEKALEHVIVIMRLFVKKMLPIQNLEAFVSKRAVLRGCE